MILWVRKSITDADKIGRGSRRYKNKPNRPSKVRFFTSDNLTDWTVASDFDRNWVFECMDFVHLPIDGDPSNKKWLLFDASFDYEMGEFDGTAFTTDKKVGLGDYGKNYYAAQTFNNSPDGIKLFRWPIKEIESLYTKKHEFTKRPIAELAGALNGIDSDLIDASIEFDPKETGDLEFDLRGIKVNYVADKNFLICKGQRLPAPPVDGKVKLRVLVDRGSLELFANDGAAAATHFALPDPKNRSISLTGKGSVSLIINELKSSWPQQT